MPFIDYYLYYSGNTDLVAGIALNGVPIFMGTSELNVDAYAPTDKSQAVASDFCLGNNFYTSYYHYYSFSPCVWNSPVKNQPIARMCAEDD